MHEVDFEQNRRLAERLLGKPIRRIARLLDAPEDLPRDLNRTFEPLLVEAESEEPIFIDVDEGKGNLIFLPYSVVRAARLDIFGEFVPVDVDWEALLGSVGPMGFTPSAVKCLSRRLPDHPADYFCMCGVKYYSSGGRSFCLGTHLTDLPAPGLWLVPPEDVCDAVTVGEL
jgi:hypothetical protein